MFVHCGLITINIQLTQPVNYYIIIIERSPLTFGNQPVKR